MQLVVFLALSFSIVIAIFAVQNTTPVSVAFLTLRADSVAVSVLILVSAALGAGVMLLLGVAREVRVRLRHRSLRQELKSTQARVRVLESEAAAVRTTEPAPGALGPALETGSVNPAPATSAAVEDERPAAG